MLYLVATPIGNLSDISQRAIETLNSCDYILCEDTRHSRHLLQKFSINKPLYSYHQHNECKRTEQTLDDLKNGKQIALISDAGTPAISDPGHWLVKACYEENIRVVPIPGACAAIAALSASPFPTDRFQFYGFLPKTYEQLKKALVSILEYPGTSVCYESPQRIVKTLAVLMEISPKAPACVCRELTKLHEEIRFSSASELHSYYDQHPPKGEIVLLIGHHSIEKSEEEASLSKQEALKEAAKLLGIPRKELYKLINQ